MNISYPYSSITDLSIKNIITGNLNKLRKKWINPSLEASVAEMTPDQSLLTPD
jgi:hypothetical protein